jgi:hypothetical protein
LTRNLGVTLSPEVLHGFGTLSAHPRTHHRSIERQIRWEAAAVEAGVRRYREELNSPGMTLADTSPGQRIIREIMAEFVPWLTDAQAVIREGLVHNQGQPRDWQFLVLLLPPDHLAYLI